MLNQSIVLLVLKWPCWILIITKITNYNMVNQRNIPLKFLSIYHHSFSELITADINDSRCIVMKILQVFLWTCQVSKKSEYLMQIALKNLKNISVMSATTPVVNSPLRNLYYWKVIVWWFSTFWEIYIHIPVHFNLIPAWGKAYFVVISQYNTNTNS